MNPEISLSIQANGIQTNYHDLGKGEPVIMIHGSGPGVSAWANWRLSLPVLAKKYRVIAPDMVGFGFTERPDDYNYTMQNWVDQLIGVMDALSIESAPIIGNSFGGALALALAIQHPDRVKKLVLMGSVGLEFELTDGLDKTWGYQPSLANMRKLLDIFAYDRNLVTDELAELRYQASIRPGFQESFEKMFPAPRQNAIKAMASSEADIQALQQDTLILHGREDHVIPHENALRLFSLIERSQLHLFGQCGHWTQIEHADRFNQLVSDFLAE